MQVLHNSKIGDFTRGGQVVIHFLRMIGQVFQKFFGAIFLLYVVTTAATWWTITDPYDRYLAFRYIGANVGVLAGNGPNTTFVRGADGTQIPTTIAQVAGSGSLKERTKTLGIQWVQSMGISFSVALVLSFLTIMWLLKFGRSSREEEALRGEGVVEGSELTKVLKKQKLASSIRLAQIPIVKGSEVQHILMTGSPGTGKTTAILELMDQIRKRGERCICYSPSGDFIEWFYRENDIVLNPFDARCPSWDIWQECTQPYDYARVAGSAIPDSSGADNQFWTNTGRQLVGAVVEKMSRRGEIEPTMAQLMTWVLRAPSDELSAFLKDTDAATLAAKDMERTYANIRGTVSTFIESLKYIPAKREGRTHFCIRDWVHNEDDSRWVFLNARSSQLQAARPVLSMWIQVFAQAMMDLPANMDKRLWLIIDELPSLQKVDALLDYVAQARKNGGCTVVGFQTISQLIDIYGEHAAHALVGQFATWLCLRQNDPKTAQLVSEKLGQIEVNETTQGISYGAHEYRDGVSANQQRKMRVVVTPTEVMQLDNLEGYLRLGGDLPTGHFLMEYKKRKKIAPMFVTPEVAEDVDKLPADFHIFLPATSPLEGSAASDAAGAASTTTVAPAATDLVGVGATTETADAEATTDASLPPAPATAPEDPVQRRLDIYR